MNLVLFRSDEVGQTLPATDRRALHLTEVLRRKTGDEFDAGLINGPRGKARIETMGPTGLTFSFRAEGTAERADPLILLVGLPRPQTARDVLRDATTLGVGALHFVTTEKTESSYAQSSLWRDGEWERHVLAGAEQAFSTRVPTVTFERTLAAALAELPGDVPRVTLDNYEASQRLDELRFEHGAPLVLALGPERGWGPADRTQLRAAGFVFAHLGARVLRLETAVVAALTLVKSARGTL